MKILIFAGVEAERISLRQVLSGVGHEVSIAESSQMALEQLCRDSFDVLLHDLQYPMINSATFMRQVKEIAPDVTVILMTDLEMIEAARQVMKLGAYDYVTRPFGSDELLLFLKRAADYRTATIQNTEPRGQLEIGLTVGKSAVGGNTLQNVYRQLLNGGMTLEESVAQFEAKVICRALALTNGNKARAAKVLGIPASTLKSKIKKYGIQ